MADTLKQDKATYEPPTLEVLGTVEAVTQAGLAVIPDKGKGGLS